MFHRVVYHLVAEDETLVYENLGGARQILGVVDSGVGPSLKLEPETIYQTFERRNFWLPEDIVINALLIFVDPINHSLCVEFVLRK